MAKEAPAMFFPMQGRISKAGAREVDLPHDCNIDEPVSPDCPDGMQTGYFKGNMAVYTKNVDIPAEWAGQCVFLELDGAYCNTEIFVNGHQMGMHPNGYAPYLCELTDCIKYGEKNRIAVFVNNSMMRTARWYSGTGIYRHADLRVCPPLRLTANPLYLTTVRANESSAQVKVQVEAENGTERNRKVCARISVFEDKGHGCPHGTEKIAGGECIIYVPATGKGKGCCRLFIENPKLWDLDSPNLYVAEVELCEAGKDGKWDDSAKISGEPAWTAVLDRDQARFGIRTISADAEVGLLLNGNPVKIKGGCMHHDNGILGAASFYDSEYRRLKLHKENGFNGIRCAHNPMSRDMMEACDRLGLLVFAEAFDVWNMAKNVNDYHLFFQEWWERDLTAFLERDRNHPSIFCWSIGNEITERNGLYGGAEISRKLALKVKELDPSRPVAAAMPTLFNGLDDEDTMKQLQAMMASGGPGQNMNTDFADEVWADRTEAFCAPLDLVGYNYLPDRYEMDHVRYPDRVICGTESYPDQIDRVWEKVERLPYVIGDFCWTSQDYLGETSCGNIIYQDPDLPPVSRGRLQSGDHFPARTAHCSDFDICGHDMPSLHFRKIVWGSRETYIAVQHPKNYGKASYRTSWAWEECSNDWYYPGYEGKPIQIEVYSAAEEVELLVNGVSAGCAGAGKENRYRACFETIYQPGTIEAVSRGRDGEISRQKLVSPGSAVGIRIIPDKTEMDADGQSLIFCEIEVVDEEGRRVPDAALPMTAAVSGAAVLAGFGSAAPVTEELYSTGTFTSYQGRLQAVLRSGYEPGEAVLTVRCEALDKACETQETLGRTCGTSASESCNFLAITVK